MPIVLKVVSEQDYQDWVTKMKQAQAAAAAGVDRTWTREELMERGQQIYNNICAACHQPNGQGLPPAFPALAGSAIATGPVDAHIKIVLNGKTGTAMQAFRSQLNPVDLAGVITFERNSFGNAVGDLVQPAAIHDPGCGKIILSGIQAQKTTKRTRHR